MRILHCTDLHCNRNWLDWITKVAGHYDLVCVTGDHLDLTDFQSIDAQINSVRTAFEGLASSSAITSGNTDSFNSEAAPLWLLHARWLTDLRRSGCRVDGDEFASAGVRIRCVGWNALLPSAQGDEIWLYHAPPARSSVAVDHRGRDVGDEILGEMCRAGRGPALVLSGHQHDPQQKVCRVGRTWCLNPGRGTHPKVPNHFVIDTLTRTAALHVEGRHDSTFHLT